MKKSLFALAALSAFATAAQAQSSVTLYGNADLTEAYQAGGGDKSVALTHSANTTSLWGITGSEDLGGGMKMGFDFKSELNLVNGQSGSTTTAVTPTVTAATTAGATSNVFNRGTNMFISSASMGEVKVGRMDDIEWAMSGGFSTSGSNSFGSNHAHAQIGNLNSAGLGTCAAIVAATATTGTTGLCSIAGTASAANSTYMGVSDAFMTGIQYTSPTMAGFTVKAQTGMGASSAIQGYNVGQQQSMGLFYTGMDGKLIGALAQSRRFDDQGLLGMTLTSLGLRYKVTNDITLITTATTTSVMGNSYQAPTAASSTAVYNPGVHGSDMWSVGVNYQVSPTSDVNVAYTNIQDNSTGGSANSTVIFGLTGRYNLSNRTQLYAGVGQANNSGVNFMGPIYGAASQNATVAQFPANGGSAAASNGVGTNVTGAMLGIKHSF